jgi:hypothetical protein
MVPHLHQRAAVRLVQGSPRLPGPGQVKARILAGGIWLIVLLVTLGVIRLMLMIAGQSTP